MKDIVIVSNFALYRKNRSNCRFCYIADQLSKNDKVEIVFSSFEHVTKQQRLKSKSDILNDHLMEKMVYEPGYKKNVSIKRFFSHIIWGKNVYSYLKKRKKPDLIYCAMPSLTSTALIANYCNKNNIKFAIDIQDLWPEAFEMIIPVPILFYPIKKLAEYSYKKANYVFGVSETYVNRALRINKTAIVHKSVFLGNIPVQNRTPGEKKDVFTLVYIGTVGASYDLETLVKAVSICMNHYKMTIHVDIVGDGPELCRIEKLSRDYKIDCTFWGRLNYEEMMQIVYRAHIGINPIHHRAAQSIINKVGDYALAGIPVVNSQECDEYRKLLHNWKAGVSCKNGDAADMAIKIKLLYDNSKLYKTMADNSALLGQRRFNRRNTYDDLVRTILEIMQI